MKIEYLWVASGIQYIDYVIDRIVKFIRQTLFANLDKFVNWDGSRTFVKQVIFYPTITHYE